MPIRKIHDIEPRKVCRHPDHNPPSMIVLKPGVYEHLCPACGKRVVFTIPAEVCWSISLRGGPREASGGRSFVLARWG